MSLAELEKVTKAWPSISCGAGPHTAADYREVVELLDRVTEEVGEDENYPLASLIDGLGVLIEKYEDEQVPQLIDYLVICLLTLARRRITDHLYR